MKPAPIELSVLVSSATDLADLARGTLKRVSPEEDHWSFLLSTFRDVQANKHTDVTWLWFEFEILLS